MPTDQDRPTETGGHTGGEPVAAYVVLSHRDPTQVERLVRAIRRSSANSHVFVTHDSRESPPPRPVDARVHVREHGLQTDWGSWELVQATLEAFAWARDVADPDMVALVSGADYPAKNLSDWERGFLAAGGGWVGVAEPLSYHSRWGRRLGEGNEDLTRYTYFWLPLHPTGLGDRLPKCLDRVRRRARDAVMLRIEPIVSLRFVSRGRGTHLGIRRRKTPFSRERPCFKGSQWVAMDRERIDHLLSVAPPGSALAEFYKHTIIPDESLIPTILSWACHQRPGGVLTYLTEIDGIDGPRVLLLSDLEDIEASGAPFCRKVSSPASDLLMEALDERSVAIHGPDDPQRS